MPGSFTTTIRFFRPTSWSAACRLFHPASQILSNLKKAKSYGGELEITAAPIEHMLINLNFGATHARITAVTDTGGGGPDGDILLHRLVGNWLPFAEDYSHNGSVSYDFVGDYGVLTPEIDWTYTGNYYTEKENDDQMQGTFRKKLAATGSRTRKWDGKIRRKIFCHRLRQEHLRYRSPDPQ